MTKHYFLFVNLTISLFFYFSLGIFSPGYTPQCSHVASVQSSAAAFPLFMSTIEVAPEVTTSSDPSMMRPPINMKWEEIAAQVIY